jgi:hypothetical protein
MLLSCIRVVPGSSLGRGTDNPDRYFVGFLWLMFQITKKMGLQGCKAVHLGDTRTFQRNVPPPPSGWERGPKNIWGGNSCIILGHDGFLSYVP